MFGCLQVMLQVATYIIAIEVVVIEVATTCITMFSLRLASSK